MRRTLSVDVWGVLPAQMLPEPEMTTDVAVAAAAEKAPEKIVRRRTWIVVKRSRMGRFRRRGERRRLEKSEGKRGF